jgi:hypothetical protein
MIASSKFCPLKSWTKDDAIIPVSRGVLTFIHPDPLNLQRATT